MSEQANVEETSAVDSTVNKNNSEEHKSSASKNEANDTVAVKDEQSGSSDLERTSNGDLNKNASQKQTTSVSESEDKEHSTGIPTSDSKLPIEEAKIEVPVVIEGESDVEKTVKLDEKPTDSASNAEQEVKNPVESSQQPKAETSTEDADVDSNTKEGSKPKVDEPKKKALPKWMVQSAEDLDQEVEQEAAMQDAENQKEKEKKEAEKAEGTTKRRGRGRKVDPVVAEAAAVGAPEAKVSETAGSLATTRARRSTRSNIDYSNPDPATVVAEVEDEEPGGLNVLRRGRGRGRGGASAASGRGRKRKIESDASDAEEDFDEDDGGSDYGSKKKTPKTVVKRGRGRPPGIAKANAAKVKPPKAKSVTRRSGRGKKSNSEDEEEMEFDDHESGPEVGEAESEHEEVASSNNKQVRKTPVARNSKAAPASTGKRGRPARSAKTAQEASNNNEDDPMDAETNGADETPDVEVEPMEQTA